MNQYPTLLNKPSFFAKKVAMTVAILLSSTQVFAASPNYYQVKTGDSLQSIATQYNTNVDYLIKINNLSDKDDVKVGDRILLSDITAMTYRGKTMSYTVRNGDSLSTIAKQFQTKTSVLSELNNFENETHRLYVGDKIVVPYLTTATNEPIAKTTASEPIAKTTTTNTLLTNKEPVANQELTIVNKPANTLKTVITTTIKPKVATYDYEIKSGDTLWGIASKFKVDRNELMTLNGLTVTSTLVAGDTLKIPNNADRVNAIVIDRAKAVTVTTPTPTVTIKKPVVVPVKTTTATQKVDFIDYKIKAGDSLASLATKYHTTVAGLVKINNLSVTAPLKIGQVILVPIHNTP